MTAALASGEVFALTSDGPRYQCADAVVIHNNPIQRAGIAAALSECMRTCNAATMPASAWLGATRPRVIVADHEGAMSKLAELRRHDYLQAEAQRWLVVADLLSGRRISEAMGAGVTGYVHASCQLDELRDAALAVVAGKRFLCRAAATSLAESTLWEPLTRREIDVLAMLCHGLDNKSIGLRLGVAPGTIKSHVKTLLHKLSVRSRTQAVVEAIRRGLVDDPLPKVTRPCVRTAVQRRDHGYPPNTQRCPARTLLSRIEHSISA